LQQQQQQQQEKKQSIAMATVGVERKQQQQTESTMTMIAEESCSAKTGAVRQGEGLKQYYLQHIHELQLLVRQKSHNLNRLEAQRNGLNSRGGF
jgi:26S proteasome regulatory subunit T6